MDASILYPATLIIVGLVVLVLVVYLIGIIIALWKAGTHLQNLAGGLEKIAEDTSPLKKHLTTINDALTQLHSGLTSVDNHLVSIARIFKL